MGTGRAPAPRDESPKQTTMSGTGRVRTGDIDTASVALYQLSYGPMKHRTRRRGGSWLRASFR